MPMVVQFLAVRLFHLVRCSELTLLGMVIPVGPIFESRNTISDGIG